MSQGHNPALELALAAFRSPSLYAQLRDRSLPDDLPLLLRVVAGDAQALEQATGLVRESPTVVNEAAVMVIQQLMFYPGADSYRVLGVPADAADSQIRENYRWLVRWLHPDRNDDEWDAVYADRVTTAWNDLRTPERRQRYDEYLRGSDDASHGNSRGAVSLVRQTQFVEEEAPGPDLRWLPKAVLAGLGACVVAALAVFYVLRSAERTPGADAGAGQIALSEASTPEDPNPHDSEAVEAALGPSPTLASSLPPVQQVPAAHVEERRIAPNGAHLREPAVVHQATTVDLASPREVTNAARARPSSLVAKVRVPIARSPDAVAFVAPTRVEVGDAEVARVPAAAMAGTQAVAPPVRPNRVADPPAPSTNRANGELLEANRILGFFSQAYADGDLDGMRAIFTADARSSRGGLSAILANYNQLFQSSSDRSLVVRDVSWFTAGETATIIASYQATVTEARGRRLRRTHGDLRLDLRRENEQWRIYRLLHDERPG